MANAAQSAEMQSAKKAEHTHKAGTQTRNNAAMAAKALAQKGLKRASRSASSQRLAKTAWRWHAPDRKQSVSSRLRTSNEEHGAEACLSDASLRQYTLSFARAAIAVETKPSRLVAEFTALI